MMRILACGGRDYADQNRVTAILDHIHIVHGMSVLIQGGARGADALALYWALQRGVQPITYHALWDALGRAAEDAADALCELATRLQVACQTQFNSVLLLVAPGDDPAALVRAYEAARRSDVSVATVFRPRDAPPQGACRGVEVTLERDRLDAARNGGAASKNEPVARSDEDKPVATRPFVEGSLDAIEYEEEMIRGSSAKAWEAFIKSRKP